MVCVRNVERNSTTIGAPQSYTYIYIYLSIYMCTACVEQANDDSNYIFGAVVLRLRLLLLFILACLLSISQRDMIELFVRFWFCIRSIGVFNVPPPLRRRRVFLFSFRVSSNSAHLHQKISIWKVLKKNKRLNASFNVTCYTYMRID